VGVGVGLVVGVKVGVDVGKGDGVGVGVGIGVGVGVGHGSREAESLLEFSVVVAKRSRVLFPSGYLPIVCPEPGAQTWPAPP